MKSYVPPKNYVVKNRLCISFSGGKTSAYMTKMLLDHFRNDPNTEVLVTFANTGQEHEETLKFVDRCDREFGFGVVWLEAKVNKGRVGVTSTVVSFETASKKGEPFEAYIAKYGIPNRSYNQCTSRLKTEPMDHYRERVMGWPKGTYSTAVGIRADEIDRVSATAFAKNLFYPCADAGVTKEDVRLWWMEQSFNLNIPEHLGNCQWCWKKSNRKLLTLVQTHPEIFNFPDRMEKTYALAGGARRDGEAKRPRVFFRGNRDTTDLFLDALFTDFEPYEDGKFIPWDSEIDVGGGCGDSCEIGADEYDEDDGL